MKHNIYFLFSILSLVLIAPFGAINPLIALAAVGIAGVFFFIWYLKEMKEEEKIIKKSLTNNQLDVIIITESEREVNAMRKYNEIIVGAIMFLLMFVVLPGLVGNYEHHYTREAEVIEVSDDLIVVEDNCGYLWGFYGNGYEVGQQVKMKMFTNYTHDTIFDDEIEKVEIRD